MGVRWILQEREHTIGLPSQPRLARLHSLPSFVPACSTEDALSSPGTAALVGGCTARDEGSATTGQSALVRQTNGSAALAQGPLLAASQPASQPDDE